MDKAQLRKEVEAQVAKFLANGGKVQMVAYKDKAKEKKAQAKVTA